MSTKSDADISAEIDAGMAELRAELGGDDSAPEEAAPEAESVEGDPEADEESEDEESEETEEALEDESGETARAEVAKLFADGDLKGACDKLGLDPSIFKLNNRQFAAARKAESEAKRRDAESRARDEQASSKLQQAEALNKGAEETYGPIAAGSLAYRRDRDTTKARAAIELMFGAPWEQIKTELDKGVKPLSPAELRVIELERKLEAEKANKTQTDAAAAAAAQHTADVAKVESKLAGTPLEGVEGAAEDIVKVIRASYNPALKKHTLTLKEAYQQVKAANVKKAAQLAKLSGRPPKPKDDSDERPAKRGQRKPIAGTRKPEASAPLTEEQRMDLEMAQARREFDAQQRRARKGGR